MGTRRSTSAQPYVLRQATRPWSTTATAKPGKSRISCTLRRSRSSRDQSGRCACAGILWPIPARSTHNLASRLMSRSSASTIVRALRDGRPAIDRLRNVEVRFGVTPNQSPDPLSSSATCGLMTVRPIAQTERNAPVFQDEWWKLARLDGRNCRNLCLKPFNTRSILHLGLRAADSRQGGNWHEDGANPPTLLFEKPESHRHVGSSPFAPSPFERKALTQLSVCSAAAASHAP